MAPWDHIQLPDQATLDRMLDRTKGQLFFMKGSGLLGSLLCDHQFVWDPKCGTAWCNGSTIGWNPQFFVWLTPEERVMVLAHELWHTAFSHMSRLGTVRCPDIWNQAADFVINIMLHDAGYVFGPKIMSIDPCLDPQYRGMTTEQVYNLLPKNPGQPMPQQGPGVPGPGDPSDSGHPLAGDLKAPASADEEAKIISKVVKAIQAAQQSREAGNIPGEIMLTVDQFLNPILPWEVLLARFFTELSNDDYSWKRPSRRYDHEYLPYLQGENGLEHLIYYLDVSRSITNAYIVRFNTEVKFIHDDLKPKLLTLVTFDTKIQDEYVFTDDMPFENIVVHGRGGTCLKPVKAHIEKHKPTAAVIFSDLYVHPMNKDPGTPLLWVCVDNPQAQVPFGKLIHIPKET